VRTYTDCGEPRPLTSEFFQRIAQAGYFGRGKGCSDEHTREQVLRLGLVELTAAGRREAARRLLVSDGVARQRHGILQGDDATGRFVRHLHHTLGAVSLAAVQLCAGDVPSLTGSTRSCKS
jgi:hypothetical protein